MAKKVARRSKSKQKYEDINVIELETVKNNIRAQKEGPKKKSWSVLDIKPIKPITEKQRAMTESYFMGNHIVAAGSAGSGKSFLAMWLALNTIFSKEYSQDKILIVRSIVTTGKDLGALPGELFEKIAPFETPYVDIMKELLGKPTSYDDLKEAGKIDFIPTTFIRGTTWDDAIIIVDEIQNMEIHELISICTRVGTNSRLILIGDGRQADFAYSNKLKSGFDKFMEILKYMSNSIDVITFTRDDIVRSPFVKAFICACEDAGIY